MSSKKNETVTKDASRPALVPKLRFPEFEGEWERDKLGAVATLHKGKGVSKADISLTGQVPCIRYGELYTIYGEVIALVHSRTDVPRGDLFLSKSNDVIIPASGETKLDIAKAACVLRDGVALGGDLNVIRTSHNGTFFSYYLNGPKRYHIAKVAQGDSVVHLYPSQLEKLVVAFPSGPEQQRIADCLSSLDELIGAQARKVDALKTHKKGLMQQLFPREGETQPRLRFPEFEGEWEETPLGSIALLRNGYAFKSAEYVDDGYYHVVTIANVQQGNLTIESTKRIATLPSDIQQHQVLDLGDILISMTGNVGRVCRVTARNLLLNQRVGKLVPEKIDASFVYQLLQREAFRNMMQLKAAGGAQGNLSGGDITEFVLCVPRIPTEQQRIADCLSSLDEQITTESNKLETYKTHKKGLMQKLFPTFSEN